MKKIVSYILTFTIIISLLIISGCEKEEFFTVLCKENGVCKIVYTEYDDELYKDYVRSITSLLSKITNKEISAVTVKEYSNDSENPILIGDTKLKQSNQFLTTLKYSDYGFSLSENSLCVAGHTLENTNRALSDFESFLANIKNGDEQYISRTKSGDVSLSSKGFNITKGKYCELEIDGVSIEEFSIICNEKDKKYAEDLRVFLGEKTGAFLDIFDSSKKESRNEILIGDVGRKTTNKFINNQEEPFSKYRVEIKDGKLAFLQKNSAALAANYNAFVEKFDVKLKSGNKLKLTEKDSISGEIKGNIKDRTKDTDVRIACNNVYFWERMGLPIKERCYFLYNSFELMDADVIMLQEVSQYWHETMDTSMQDMGYTLVPTDDSIIDGVKAEDNYTPIWYRADKLKLIDYGYNQYSSVKYKPDGNLSMSKSYTWAVFEDNKGKRVACLSTHFTWAPDHFIPSPTELRNSDAIEAVAAIKIIEEKYPDVPVVLMGDLNSAKTSEAYNILASQLLDVREKAKIAHNTNYGSYHKVGEYPTNGGYVIDHTFTNNKNVDLLQYQFAVNEWSVNSTDHIPFLLDVALK